MTPKGGARPGAGRPAKEGLKGRKVITYWPKPIVDKTAAYLIKQNGTPPTDDEINTWIRQTSQLLVTDYLDKQ